MSNERRQAEETYLAAIKAREAGALGPLRARAGAAFATAGLPHRRVEAFKYTDMRAFDRGAYPVSTAPVQTVVEPDGEGLSRLSLAEALSASADLLEEALSAPLVELNPLADLNLALMEEGVVIEVKPGVEVTEPLTLSYAAKGEEASATFVRNVIILGEGASLDIVEEFAASGAASLNAVTTVVLGNGARLRHSRFDEGSSDSLVFSLLDARLGGNTHLEANALSTGGKAARIESQVRFEGEEATATLNGLLLGKGRDHIDHTTYVQHDVPHCSAEENFRTILSDRAQGVFQGKITVGIDAQKTDSRMMARGLLLSDDASIRSKPELEIYADDVKCAHGSSIGNLDEDALFYMMSRGIPEEKARALLVEAFSADVLDAITSDAIRDKVKDRLTMRLATMLGGSA